MKDSNAYLCSIYAKRDEKLKAMKRRKKAAVAAAIPMFAVVVAAAALMNLPKKSADAMAAPESNSIVNVLTDETAFGCAPTESAAGGGYNAEKTSPCTVPEGVRDDFTSSAEGEKTFCAETGVKNEEITFSSINELIELKKLMNGGSAQIRDYANRSGFTGLDSSDKIEQFFNDISSVAIPEPGSTAGELTKISFSYSGKKYEFTEAVYTPGNGEAVSYKRDADFTGLTMKKIGDLIK